MSTQAQRSEHDLLERYKTAFQHFSDDQRPQIKRCSPNIKHGDMAILLANKWQQLDSNGRKLYERMAKLDKRRYNAEKELFDMKRRRNSI